jgi:hypothetical protein
MSGVRNWAEGSAIAALVLLSPIVAFLMVMAAETAIDFLIGEGDRNCAVVAGVIGWVLFRKRASHPAPVSQSGWEQVSDEATAPPPG